MKSGYLAHLIFFINKRNNFFADLLRRIYSLRHFVRSDSDVMVDKACMPVISVASNTIFNEYRDILCRHIYNILILGGAKPFIACCDGGYVNCTLHVDGKKFSTKQLGENAISLSECAEVYFGKDLCVLAKSGKNACHDVMVVCGSNVCSNYERFVSPELREKKKNIRGIRCKHFEEDSKYKDKYIHRCHSDLSILVIDACLGFANEAPYPFGILARDLDKMLIGVEIAIIVGGNAKQIKDIEEILLSRCSEIEIFCFNISVANISNAERYLLFTRSTIADSIKTAISNSNVKLIDCIKYKCNHRYNLSCIVGLLRKTDANKARLITTRLDHRLIVESVEAKISSYNRRLARGGSISKHKAITSKIQALESILESCKKNIDVLDFSFDDNDLFTERILHVTNIGKETQTK